MTVRSQSNSALTGEQRARRLAMAILKLESSPLQQDYVPPHIQQLARELLAAIGPHDTP